MKLLEHEEAIYQLKDVLEKNQETVNFSKNISTGRVNALLLEIIDIIERTKF